jgi:hypothetical protein
MGGLTHLGSVNDADREKISLQVLYSPRGEEWDSDERTMGMVDLPSNLMDLRNGEPRRAQIYRCIVGPLPSLAPPPKHDDLESTRGLNLDFDLFCRTARSRHRV